MWELYEDDESFQRMAKGKGAKGHGKGHDAKLLAKVLYGKKVSQISEKAITDKQVNQDEKKKVAEHVQFKQTEGKFIINSTLMKEEEEEESEYMSRSKDYTFQPVKTALDFLKSGVQTDVCIFDRSVTSEFDEEREELKDDLVAWNIRYQARLNK